MLSVLLPRPHVRLSWIKTNPMCISSGYHRWGSTLNWPRHSRICFLTPFEKVGTIWRFVPLCLSLIYNLHSFLQFVSYTIRGPASLVDICTRRYFGKSAALKPIGYILCYPCSKIQSPYNAILVSFLEMTESKKFSTLSTAVVDFLLSAAKLGLQKHPSRSSTSMIKTRVSPIWWFQFHFVPPNFLSLWS
jgi:hypothetical protein